MEQSKNFVFDAYVFAFKNTLSHMRVLTFSVLIYLASVIPFIAFIAYLNKPLISMLRSAGDNWRLALVSYVALSGIMVLVSIILFLFFLTWIFAGFCQLCLAIHDHREEGLSNLFPNPLRILKFFIALFCFVFITFIGILCFVVPGMYWIIRSRFFLFALADGKGIMESFSTSFRITQNKTWPLWGQLTADGMLRGLSPYLIFIPTLSAAYVYRYLEKEGK